MLCSTLLAAPHCARRVPECSNHASAVAPQERRTSELMAGAIRLTRHDVRMLMVGQCEQHTDRDCCAKELSDDVE